MCVAEPSLSANLLAALLLAGLPYLRELGLTSPTGKAVLKATGAGRSQAYALAARLMEQLPQLGASVGRPKKMPETVSSDGIMAATQVVLAHVYAHPGAVERGIKTHYSDGFRQLVVEQCIQRGLDIEAFAKAIDIPASTLRQWLRGSTAKNDIGQKSSVKTVKADSLPGNLQVQTIIDQWSRWDGTFVSFCEHLRRHHAIDMGRTAIAAVLECAGQRTPRRRPGRTPDEEAIRKALVTFFAGAQWTADGCEVKARVGDSTFAVNLELVVDTFSAALVGLDVRKYENASALVAAHLDGVHATGANPLSALVDNKPSNFAPSVSKALGETLLIPASPGRPQSKGHVEGAFGLFSQHAPPLVLDAQTDEQRALQLVDIATRCFFGALNLRPRKARNGLSRIELYRQSAPSPEQVERAKLELQARLDKQRRAAQTRRARQNPATRETLGRAFVEFGFVDPAGNLLDGIARYPFEYVTRGIAIFAGKRNAGTLPENVDARYLLGIVKHTTDKAEGLAIARELWDRRIEARDIALEHLRAELEHRTRIHSDLDQRIADLADAIIDAPGQFDRHFWIDAIATCIREQPTQNHRAHYDAVARRVHSAFRITTRERQDILEQLSAKLIPLP